jgi:hypothetical protein
MKSIRNNDGSALKRKFYIIEKKQILVKFILTKMCICGDCYYITLHHSSTPRFSSRHPHFRVWEKVRFCRVMYIHIHMSELRVHLNSYTSRYVVGDLGKNQGKVLMQRIPGSFGKS